MMMQDPIQQLYQGHAYPAMSHPRADPAVSAVAARIGGLKTAHPARARILEIGCNSGHHLIPLAIRWPASEFMGLDLSAGSIDLANRQAMAAGVKNVDFKVADLRDYQPEGGPFDFIIAHGFFSWVPDDVKAKLFDFCRENLAENGIATVSFNLECGWKSRLPVIEKTRAIRNFKDCELTEALEILRSISEPDSRDVEIIDDMLAKGAAVLACDDFGPINDPWSLERFVKAAGNAGLRWLGETVPSENFPDSLGDEAIQELSQSHSDPLALQTAADDLAQRTFRSGILCRGDAPVDDAIQLSMILDFAVRPGRFPDGSEAVEIWQALKEVSPACMAVKELMQMLPGWEPRALAAKIFDGIVGGWILARVEPVSYDPVVPAFPCLSAFRLECARVKLPLVDAWHQPCQFPENHYLILTKMDGSRSLEDLATLARSISPNLAFEPWIGHLADRGMFS